jgi:hypothetical protein
LTSDHTAIFLDKSEEFTKILETMNKLLRAHLIGLLFLVFTTVSFSQTPKNDNSMPSWLRQHMEFMTRGSGRWITDNSAFKSKDEPSDAYGTEWKWGIGKQSIRGRLFGIQGGKETDTFWEYLLFWHPNERRAIFQQFGSSGVFGTGEMQSLESGDKTERMTEMVFYTPDGTSWRDLHRLLEFKEMHQTISFDFTGGGWKQGRTYVWKLEDES